MPVWGVWHDGAFWFSTAGRSRKARNLLAVPDCTVHTETPDPVVVDGVADPVRGFELDEVLDRYNAKYPMEPPDVAENPIFRVTPRSVFGLEEAAFTTSPTRWVFD